MQSYSLKFKIIFLLIFCFFLAWPKPVRAWSFKIESINPSSVSSKNDEVEVVLSITDLPSESYLRVAWQEGEGKQYFGYVKNEKDEWVQIKSLGSDCSNYYHVTNTGTFPLTLKTKIGEDKELTSGTYLLKAHRFTTGCSDRASENSVEISVNLPEPTPTPSPTPTQESEPTATATPTPQPEASHSPTPKPTKKPTATPTPTPKSGVLGEESEIEETTFLLSELGEESEEQKKEETEKQKKGIGQWLPPIMIGGGVILIGVAAFPFIYPRLKNKLRKEEFDQEAS